MKKAFDQWLDYMDITFEERAEEAKELARQELLKEKEELENARTLDMSNVELKLRD